MEPITNKRAYDGYIFRHRPFEEIHSILSSVEAKHQLSKRLIFQVEELVFGLFIAILVPIVIMVTSLVVTWFYINHLHTQVTGSIKRVIKQEKILK